MMIEMKASKTRTLKIQLFPCDYNESGNISTLGENIPNYMGNQLLTRNAPCDYFVEIYDQHKRNIFFVETGFDVIKVNICGHGGSTPLTTKRYIWCKNEEEFNLLKLIDDGDIVRIFYNEGKYFTRRYL